MQEAEAPAIKLNVKFRNICIACNILLNTIRPQDTSVAAQTVNVNIVAFPVLRSSKPKMNMIFRTTSEILEPRLATTGTERMVCGLAVLKSVKSPSSGRQALEIIALLIAHNYTGKHHLEYMLGNMFFVS